MKPTMFISVFCNILKNQVLQSFRHCTEHVKYIKDNDNSNIVILYSNIILISKLHIVMVPYKGIIDSAIIIAVNYQNKIQYYRCSLVHLLL